MINEADFRTLMSLAVVALESALEIDDGACRNIVRLAETQSGRTAAELLNIGRQLVGAEAKIVHVMLDADGRMN